MTEADRLREEALSLVAAYCSTSIGETFVRSLRAGRDVKEDFEDISAALSEHERGMSLSFPSIPDISEVFTYLERYGTLDGERLVLVGRFIEKVMELRERIHSNRLARYLIVPKHLLRVSREIRENIDPSGKVRLDRHSALADLVRKRNELREKLLDLYSDVIERHAEKLRERRPVLRGGRLSLAVISNFKIEGIVHGFSDTTETVFVEPYEVVPLQNTLIQVEDRLREYEDRVIRDLAHKVVRSIDSIRSLYENLGRLDSVFARAKFALDFKATLPKFGRKLKIKGGKEPVLYRVKRGNVVPLDLDMDSYALLITGPNAGGKTVSLRTVGFAVLMASLGIPVPAEYVEIPEGAHLYMLGFENESDIRSGLSNFTRELQSLKEIISQVKEGDVVLFDEIFASTDPDEASALAYSIAKYLSERKVYLLMSTHFSTLKLLSKTSSFIKVASVDGYRLSVGKVGESEGLRTARAFLPSEIISYAHHILREVPSYIVRLKEEYTKNLQKLAKEREEVKRTLKEMRTLLSSRGRDVNVALEKLKEVKEDIGEEIEEGKEYFIRSLGVKGKVVKVEGERVKVKVRNFVVDVKKKDIV